MKRNRLVSPSKRGQLFSDTLSSVSHSRYLLPAAVISVALVALTGFFSGDGETKATVQSSVIDLPGLPASEQLNTALVSPTTLTLPDPKKVSEPETVSELADEVAGDLAAAEAAAVETAELNETIAEAAVAAALDWQEVTVKSGDNLSLIFPRVGLTARDVYHVTQLDKDTISPLLNLKPGQVIHVGTVPDDDDSLSLESLKIVLSPISTFLINKDNESYVAETVTREVELRQRHVTGQINSSLFESGLTAGLSDKVIMEMAHIFGWDIDFALDLRQGDHYKLIFNEHFLDGEKIDDGEILAAEFTNRGKSFQAVRFTDDEGRGLYYSPEGDSMRKTFTRTPVPLSRISSRYNPNRLHPVLKTVRPHRGVDYAAKTGTPILATGDGKVAFKGRKGGYGRTIILSHGGKYTTLYAHMSRYRKGLKVGKRVKQGQTIGYIGKSGLATGPHLHYEFRVNGVHRNPLTVKLPKAEALPKKYRADFKQQSTPLLAQLEQLQATAIAQSE